MMLMQFRQWLGLALNRVFFLCGCLLLSACQTSNIKPLDGAANMRPLVEDDFSAFYQVYDRYTAWQLRAAFSFVNKTENGQGKLIWQQSVRNAEPYAEIQLLGPLGAGAVRVSISPQLSTLQQGKRVYKAPSAQQLMQEILAWNMPVDALSYWVFGLPAQSVGGDYQLDDNGDIIQLRQLGWHIQFKQYRQLDGIELNLPRKIFATHAQTGTKIRLAVTSLKSS